jgi:hypothetical protein
VSLVDRIQAVIRSQATTPYTAPYDRSKLHCMVLGEKYCSNNLENKPKKKIRKSTFLIYELVVIAPFSSYYCNGD